MLENVLDKTLSFLLRPYSAMRIFRGFVRSCGFGSWACLLVASVGIAVLGGCSRLRPKPAAEYVYVTAQQTFLRDRVAAVSNRTGTVQNGDRLVVLEHGRRFFRVRSPEGAEGWIDQKAVATQQVYDAFQALREAHQGDAAVASAVVRDTANLHLKPGRETDRFYQLGEGDKLQLLERATLPKPAVWAAAVKTPASGTGKGAKTAVPEAAPIAMEDWWLARDAKGRTGWLLSHYLDVDVPSSVAQYAEEQRIVGAYVLTTVYDPAEDQANVASAARDGGTVEDSGTAKGGDRGGAKNRHREAAKDEDSGIPTDGKIPIYLTVTGSYAAGLPYDFDQVRVFTWNMKMHRYETAFREKNIEGYLPVTVRMATDPYGKSGVALTSAPTFSYRVLAADAGPVAPDPVTGMVTPGRTIEKTYRLEGNLVRRVAPPGSKDEAEAHPVVEEKKEKVGKGKKR
jgi:SH3-like domain-containing protein